MKDIEEVSFLNESAKILSKSFEEIPQLIREGMTELELARKLQDLNLFEGRDSRVRPPGSIGGQGSEPTQPCFIEENQTGRGYSHRFGVEL